MNLAGVFLLVSAIVLIQITALLCMHEDPGDSTILPLRSLVGQRGKHRKLPVSATMSTSDPSYKAQELEKPGTGASTNTERSAPTLSNVMQRPSVRHRQGSMKILMNKTRKVEEGALRQTINPREDKVNQKLVNWMTVQELTPTVRDMKELTPTVRDMKELTPSLSGMKELTPTVRDMKELTPTVRDMKELTPTVRDMQDLIPSVRDMKELTPSVPEMNELASSLPVMKELTPTVREMKELTPSSSGMQELTSILKQLSYVKNEAERMKPTKHTLKDLFLDDKFPSLLQDRENPGLDQKDVNWVIRIKQVVDDKNDDNREVDVAEIKVNGEDLDNSKAEQEMKVLLNESPVRRRRLMAYKSGRENNEVNTVPREPTLDVGQEATPDMGREATPDMGREATPDMGEMSQDTIQEATQEAIQDSKKAESDTDTEDPGEELMSGRRSDAANVASALKEVFKKELNNPDTSSGKMEELKKRLRNVDMSLLLGQDLPYIDDEPSSPGPPVNLSGVYKNVKHQKELVDGLLKTDNDDMLRSGDKVKKDYDYEEKEEMNDPEGAKMRKMINVAERENLAEASPETMEKRSVVDDGSGRYGVSVEENDNVPNEYDIENENGVEEIRYPRGSKTRRRRRETRAEHTTKGHGVVEHGEKHAGNVDHISHNARVGGDHHMKHGEILAESKVHPQGQIIGIGYILVNGAASSITHGGKHLGFVSHAENIHGHRRYYGPHHHRCNMSHALHGGYLQHKGHKIHPCHHYGHWRHHGNYHHVIGRPYNPHGYNHHPDPHGGYKHKVEGEGHPAEFYFHENHFGKHELQNHDNKGHHVEGHHVEGHHHAGDKVAIVPVNQRHRTSHSSNTVHVFVILSIFLICFTVVLFAIVKSRLGNHVKEVNSRTALFVPQPKY